MHYILLVYSEGEPYGRSVGAYVKERANIPVLVINTETPPSISVEFDGQGKMELVFEGERYGEPVACWSRNKIFGPPRTLTTEDVYLRLRANEWRGFINGVMQLFKDRKVNGGHASSSKIYQYQAATAAGFRLPAGSFFVGKEAGLSFLQRHPRSVMKGIGYPNLPDPTLRSTSTTLVTTDVDHKVFEHAAEERFTTAPVWFQERLSSGVEYRVIATPTYILPCRMSDRVEDRRFVDGRMDSPPFEICELGQEVRECINRYFSVTGLDYGVFDFIECEGTLYFLECNPEGQWHSAIQTDRLEEVAAAVGDLILERAKQFGSAVMPSTPLRLEVEPAC